MTKAIPRNRTATATRSTAEPLEESLPTVVGAASVTTMGGATIADVVAAGTRVGSAACATAIRRIGARSVIATGGKQYRVSEGTVVRVEKLDVDAGATVEFNQVLLIGEGVDVSVGAPGDEFNANGQDWGLTPFIPGKLRAAHYRPFIETIRAMLRHAGGLRTQA